MTFYNCVFVFVATKGKDGDERCQTNRGRECRHTQILSVHGRWIDDNIFRGDFPILRVHGRCVGELCRHSVAIQREAGIDDNFYLFSLRFQAMAFISVAILLASYQFMAFMSKAKVSETGAILDSGNDLNIEGGIAE